jgi:hypothetical protein
MSRKLPKDVAMLMLKTIDLLGGALAAHKHEWSDEERDYYEATAAKLQEWTTVKAKRRRRP